MERGKYQITGKSSHAISSSTDDINPCIYKRFCDNLDLEEHGDDVLVCGLTSNLELLAHEFKESFLGKEG